MLYITTNKIKHSTVGSSFTVSFSVAPDEVWYLQKLYDSFHTINMCGIPLTLHKTDYYVAKVEDEPQTETGIAKAIVHKMIDDAVIAEDAYPDLRQKMHDAVDEYEPQTERSNDAE